MPSDQPKESELPLGAVEKEDSQDLVAPDLMEAYQDRGSLEALAHHLSEEVPMVAGAGCFRWGRHMKLMFPYLYSLITDRAGVYCLPLIPRQDWMLMRPTSSIDY